MRQDNNRDDEKRNAGQVDSYLPLTKWLEYWLFFECQGFCVNYGHILSDEKDCFKLLWNCTSWFIKSLHTKNIPIISLIILLHYRFDKLWRRFYDPKKTFSNVQVFPRTVLILYDISNIIIFNHKMVLQTIKYHKKFKHVPNEYCTLI